MKTQYTTQRILYVNLIELTATTPQGQATLKDKTELLQLTYRNLFETIATVSPRKVKALTEEQQPIPCIPYLSAFTITIQYMTGALLRALKYAYMMNIELTINGEYFADFQQFKKYDQAIFDYRQAMEDKETITQIINRIMRDPVLLKEYSKGIDALHVFLDAVIYDSGYDVSMNTATTYDKLSHVKWRDNKGEHEFDFDYTRKGQAYTTTLLDKLNMYDNIQYYKAHGFMSEREAREKEMADYDNIVIPVSACDLTAQMILS